MVTIKKQKDTGKIFCELSIFLFLVAFLLLILDSHKIFDKTFDQTPNTILKTYKQVNHTELINQFTSMINEFYKNKKIAVSQDNKKPGNNGWLNLTLQSNFFYNFIDDLKKLVINNPNDNEIFLHSISQVIRYDLYSEMKFGNLNLVNSITNLSHESQIYLSVACKIVTKSSFDHEILDDNLPLMKLYAEEIGTRLFSKWINDYFSYLEDIKELNNMLGINIYNGFDLLNVIPKIRSYNNKVDVKNFIDFAIRKL